MLTVSRAVATEANVAVSILMATLQDADTASESRIRMMDDEWSEKMGEIVQKNSQLRVEAKQAARRAAAAEEALTTAQARIAALEVGFGAHDTRAQRLLVSGGAPPSSEAATAARRVAALEDGFAKLDARIARLRADAQAALR